MHGQKNVKFGKMLYSGAGHIATWCMCLVCSVPKATNTHSKYVILIAFPLQKWLHERTLVLRFAYITCVVTRTSETERILCSVGSEFLLQFRLIFIVKISCHTERLFWDTHDSKTPCNCLLSIAYPAIKRAFKGGIFATANGRIVYRQSKMCRRSCP